MSTVVSDDLVKYVFLLCVELLPEIRGDRVSSVSAWSSREEQFQKAGFVPVAYSRQITSSVRAELHSLVMPPGTT